MFDALTRSLSRIASQLAGRGRLSERDVDVALAEVKVALLEADVALPVVEGMLGRVRARALGSEVSASLTPGQMLIKVVRDELAATLRAGDPALDLRTRPPAVILLAGLQGAGKTTTAAKLAAWLKAKPRNKKALLVSTDLSRPAAIDQLERLSAQAGARFMRGDGADPVAIARAARDHARLQFMDVLIVDTAGRSHVDAALMDEVARIHAALEPIETLFVIDAMAGQDAANAARAFGAALPLTGVIVSKADGDARGGAALSVAALTGKPIKFLGVSEKLDGLEAFDADRVAGRILGMGDVLALIERAQAGTDAAKAEALARKLQKGEGFDLADFRDQLRQMLAMGGLGAMLKHLPGAGRLPPGVHAQADDRVLKHQVAIVDSMTLRERQQPGLIDGSRRRRIASGAGVQVQDVNRLLQQFDDVRRAMKRMKGGGMRGLMRSLGGRLPPGFPGGGKR
jgi:signal recognition particle subunit SRP54